MLMPNFEEASGAALPEPKRLGLEHSGLRIWHTTGFGILYRWKLYDSMKHY